MNSLKRGMLWVVLFLALCGWANAQSNSIVYQDSLSAGWDDWSWSSTRDFASTAQKYSGTSSISVTYSAYGALSLHHIGVVVTNYHFLEFYIYGGTNRSMDVEVFLTCSNTDFAAVRVTNYVPGGTLTSAWKFAKIPIGDLNCTSQWITRINWKETAGHTWGAVYFDSITLVNTNAPTGDTNAVNEFSITSRWSEADGGLAIEFSGQTCAYYQVWMATSLMDGAWSEVGMMLGAEALQVWTNNSTTDTAFVKFSGLLHKDSWDADADGLLDVYELTHLPLNPLSPFSDADGMPDGWEFQYGLSPTNATGNDGDSGDPDGDGRSNLIEYSGGMNPQYVERNELPLYLDYGSGPWFHDGNGGGWIDPSSTSYVLSNQYAMRVGLPSNNALAILRVVGSNYLDTTGFTNLEFWINGGPTNGQKPYLAVRLEENTWPGGVPLADYVTVQSNAWSQVRIPLTHIGAGGVSNLSWIFLKNTGAVAVSQFWMDNVKLVKPWPPAAPAILVDATHTVSPILTKRIFGLNVAAWDAIMTNSDTLARLREGGFKMLRYPGGSLADYYDWQNNRHKTNPSTIYAVNTSNFLAVADGVGAEKNITVNYGRGSSAEASNWVKYVFGTLNKTVEWWCVGNECFASWEDDTNTPAHDAVKYVSRWCQYRTAMTNARPGIKVGVVGTYDEGDFTNTYSAVTNPVNGTIHGGWSPVMLTQLARSNQVPDFYELHYYGYSEGGALLIPPDRASDYHLLRSGEYERRAVERCRKMLCDYLGPTNGSNVAIHVTENNCASYNPGKQFLSLINGMFVPEMFNQAALAGADAFLWWDLHNSPYTNYNNSTTLYGWRNYGDYGVLAVGASVPLGDSINEPYPPFYGFKLLTNFSHPGDVLVDVTNNYPDALRTYACIPPDTGSVRLLVINMAPDSGLRPTIGLAGFNAGSNATAFSYVISNDLNREDITVTSVTVNPTNIQYAFPKYSMTVLKF